MKMRLMMTVALAAACVPALANDLDSFGLAGLEQVSDTEANEVRGLGLASASSSGMTMYNFFVFDQNSGSQFNIASNNYSAGSDRNTSNNLDETVTGELSGTYNRNGIDIDGGFKIDMNGKQLFKVNNVELDSFGTAVAGGVDFDFDLSSFSPW